MVTLHYCTQKPQEIQWTLGPETPWTWDNPHLEQRFNTSKYILGWGTKFIPQKIWC